VARSPVARSSPQLTSSTRWFKFPVMALQVLIGVAAVLGLLLVVAATRPAKFRIERSITIAAPPERPFAEVNDVHNWPAWSPWEANEGRMTIERSEAPRLVGLKLELFKPWKATNVTTFSFDPAPEGTKVTWTMDGTNNFSAKAFSLFTDMDELVGRDLERGLTALKTVAETRPVTG
jgi:hypothetical protein